MTFWIVTNGYKHDNEYRIAALTMKTTNVNTILYFFQLLFLCKCHYIQKCCDRKKQLTENFDTCVDFDGNEGFEKYEVDGNRQRDDDVHVAKAGENFTHHVWWLPPDIKFVSSKTQASGYKLVEIPFNELTNIKFFYNKMFPCPLSEREVVPFTDYVFILENGSLLITNIEDNVRPRTMMFPYNSYCLDRVKRYSHLLDHSFAIILCPCLYMPCVRMCCGWKHFLNFTQTPEICKYSANISLKWNLKYKDELYQEKLKFPERYSIIQNIPKCEHGEYHLNENSTTSRKFWILPNGNINAEGHLFDITFKDYCIHYWNSNGTFRTNLRICKTPLQESIMINDSILYGTYYLIGAFFLALTLLIYGVVKELRTTVHAYYLICHVFCMFISSLMMAINEFFWLLPTNFCIIVAYAIQFFFISAILWLNVMCVDISDAFSGYTTSNEFNLPKNGIRRFLTYSIYAWGVSLTITFITIIADNTSIFEKSYRPEFGIRKCWFWGSVAKFIYFYFPVSLILAYNLYLFLCTSRQICKLQRDSRRLFNESNRHIGTNNVKKDTHRMVLHAKLFALMGLTWIFEILSWIIDGAPYYWYLTDAINALRGLFIFLIFCCKKKILQSFFNTCLNISEKVHRRRDPASNSSTKTTSMSTTSVASKTNSIQLEVLDGSCGNNKLNLDCSNNDNGDT